MFEIGQVYDRRREIHGPYGGQWQSGISTPTDPKKLRPPKTRNSY